jgi:hypothetical protein
MTVKLVAVDIDRTLLDDQRRLSDENLSALDYCVKHDIAVALCSGRDLPSTLAVARPMGLPVWLVIQNGSLVLDPSGAAVYTCSLAPDVATAAVAVLERFDLAPVVYEVYPRAQSLWWQCGARSAPGMAEFRQRHGAEITYVEDIRSVLRQPVSHLEVFDDATLVFEAETELKSLPGVVPITNMSSSLKGAALMGIYPDGTAKEVALERLAGSLGLGAADVLAIGDNFNDVGMVKWAGMGVMMSNGPEEARKVAKWVAPSNNESGVAAAIRRYVE